MIFPPPPFSSYILPFSTKRKERRTKKREWEECNTLYKMFSKRIVETQSHNPFHPLPLKEGKKTQL